MPKARQQLRTLAARARALRLVLLLLAALSRTALAQAPLAPEEVREQRLIRAERPLWREALALPNHVVLLATWPLKQALFWGEDARLHNRIADIVLFPIRRGHSQP